ncbi:hypothetical protein KHQ82_04455 [Mycoplasmatota bacterium]|nr:hypothetical protein KHQ82_04455 [Mycoplasmatota bacterium]
MSEYLGYSVLEEGNKSDSILLTMGVDDVDEYYNTLCGKGVDFTSL